MSAVWRSPRRWAIPGRPRWRSIVAATTRSSVATGSAHRPNVGCTLGLLSLVQGAWADASARLEEAAAEYAARIGNVHVWPERLLAELDLLQERPGVALARLQAMLDREGGP